MSVDIQGFVTIKSERLYDIESDIAEVLGFGLCHSIAFLNSGKM